MAKLVVEGGGGSVCAPYCYARSVLILRRSQGSFICKASDGGGGVVPYTPPQGLGPPPLAKLLTF